MGRKEIRIAGFGGQGGVLAGNIVGKAASIYDKEFATLTQSYGPESRGGSCCAEIIIGDAPVDYPYVAHLRYRLSCHRMLTLRMEKMHRRKRW